MCSSFICFCFTCSFIFLRVIFATLVKGFVITDAVTNASLISLPPSNCSTDSNIFFCAITFPPLFNILFLSFITFLLSVSFLLKFGISRLCMLLLFLSIFPPDVNKANTKHLSFVLAF